MQPRSVFSRFIASRCRGLCAILFLSVLISACGGGSGGSVDSSGQSSGNVPTPNTNGSPITSGAVLISASSSMAEVGKVLSIKLNIAPNDVRSSIVGLTIVNPTVGGAMPSLNLDGTMNWQPNPVDINTGYLHIVATDSVGGSTEMTFPVRVYQEQIIFETVLNAGTDVYSDSQGAYVVKTETLDGKPLSGSVKVSELSHRDGGRSLSVTASSPNVVAFLISHPRGNAVTGSTLITQAAIKVVTPGMKYQDGLSSGISMGSVNRYGTNIYTTREEVYKWDTNIFLSKPNFELWESTKVIQVDSTCKSQSECAKQGIPIILIHGFNPEIFTLGGGEGTWGSLVKHLTAGSDPKLQHDVFEFRWMTHMRFEEAAGRLATVIRRVNQLTGKKPLIIAHSYGGIVSHLALSGQGVNWVDGNWASVSTDGLVERLVTLGSPVSGINNKPGQVGNFGSDQLTFPMGRDVNDWTIKSCLSITCVQAGAFDVLSDLTRRNHDLHDSLYWIKHATNTNTPAAEKKLADQDFSAGVLHIRHGETIHKLKTSVHSVPTHVFVGVSGNDNNPISLNEASLGDFLISVRGQIHPLDQNSVFISNSTFSNFAFRLAIDKPNSSMPYPMVSTTGGLSRKYYFLPNARHTATPRLHISPQLPSNAVPEPFVLEDGKVSYCNGQSWYYRDGDFACSAEQLAALHPLVAMNQVNGILDVTQAVSFPSSNPWVRTFSVLSDCPIPRICTQSNGPVINLPVSFELRRKATGDRVLVSRSYSTDTNGQLIVDLQEMLGAIPPDFNRADYYARLTLGDAVTYELKTIVLDDLSAEIATLSDIVLQRKGASGTGSAAGRVIDQSGRPVVNAMVTLRAGVNLGVGDFVAVAPSTTARVVYTDASGNFAASGLRATEFTVRIRGGTFLQKLQPGVNVPAGGTASQDYIVTATSCDPPLVLQTGGCIGSVPTISAFNPANAVALVPTTFKITGTNLPATDHLDITFNGCANIQFVSQSAAQHQFTCTPTVAGTLTAVIRTLPGTTPLGSFPVVVSAVITVGADMQIATITAAASDSTTKPGPVPNNGTTDDTTPTFSGTLSAPLTSGQRVNVYDGNTQFTAVAVVTPGGTTWTFTPATPLIGGLHSFTAEVADFQGIPGARSAAYVVNVLSTSVASVSPGAMTRTLPGSFDIVGRDLPTSGLSVTVPGDAKAVCQAPTNLTASGFKVACQFYKLGAQTLEIRTATALLGTVTVNVKTNVTGVTWTSPSTTSSGTVKFGETVAFKVAGVNMLADPTMGFAVQLCGVSNTEIGTPSNTLRTFSCNFNNTAGAVAGQMPGVVKDAPGGQVLFDGWNVAVEVPVAPPTATGKLPDTGITASQCYAAGSNALVSCTSAAAIALNSQQDGMLGRDVASNDNTDGKAGFSYTKIGANGELLAASASAWSCVKDNITGLMWEVKTADGGLRDKNKTYTNYDSTISLQIGGTTAPTQVQIDAATNSIGFVKAVNTAGLCGAANWRLPEPDELQGIVDYGVAYPGPTIDATWFLNTPGNAFWSSSPYVGDANGAWYVYFNYGNVSGYYRDLSFYVRLVRAGQ